MPKASSSSSKRKRGASISEADSDASNEVVTTSDGPAKVDDGQSKKLCTLCGGAPAKVQKDSNYDSMMQLYFCTLGIDVKPEVCNKADVCQNCFQKIVTYFETNDIIVYFENYFKALRTGLLKKTLKGLDTWEGEGIPLNSILEQVKRKYGSYATYKDPNERESKHVKKTLEGYTVECYEVVDGDDDNDDAPPRKGMKIGRRNEITEKDKKQSKISLQKGTSNDDGKEGSDSNDS